MYFTIFLLLKINIIKKNIDTENILVAARGEKWERAKWVNGVKRYKIAVSYKINMET